MVASSPSPSRLARPARAELARALVVARAARRRSGARARPRRRPGFSSRARSRRSRGRRRGRAARSREQAEQVVQVGVARVAARQRLERLDARVRRPRRASKRSRTELRTPRVLRLGVDAQRSARVGRARGTAARAAAPPRTPPPRCPRSCRGSPGRSCSPRRSGSCARSRRRACRAPRGSSPRPGYWFSTCAVAVRGALVLVAVEVEVADLHDVGAEPGAQLAPERLALARLGRVREAVHQLLELRHRLLGRGLVAARRRVACW